MIIAFALLPVHVLSSTHVRSRVRTMVHVVTCTGMAVCCILQLLDKYTYVYSITTNRSYSSACLDACLMQTFSPCTQCSGTFFHLDSANQLRRTLCLTRTIGLRPHIAIPGAGCACWLTRTRHRHSMVMSEHAFHTWAVSSQSQRQPRTYSPGAKSAGIATVSMILTVVGQLPAQGPGLKPYLPTAIGARTGGCVPFEHGGANSASGDCGSGFIAHMLPAGQVPVVQPGTETATATATHARHKKLFHPATGGGSVRVGCALHACVLSLPSVT
jgi:hypothetical protein